MLRLGRTHNHPGETARNVFKMKRVGLLTDQLISTRTPIVDMAVQSLHKAGVCEVKVQFIACGIF